MTCNISIKDVVHRFSHVIFWPQSFISTPFTPPRIWIKIVDKTNPTRVHEPRQGRECLALVGEGIDGNGRISDANGVVENESDLLKMRNSRNWRYSGGNGVKAVAERWDARSGPCLARQSAPSNKCYIAVERCCPPILCSVRWAEDKIGPQGSSDVG